MPSRKCPTCGFVNFARAETCKRCEAGLDVSEERTEAKTSFEEYETYEAPSRRPFSPLRVLLLILLVGGAIWFYCQSSEKDVAGERASDEKKQQQLQRKNGDMLCPPGSMRCG
jgi:hypothetical protein